MKRWVPPNPHASIDETADGAVGDVRDIGPATGPRPPADGPAAAPSRPTICLVDEARTAEAQLPIEEDVA